MRHPPRAFDTIVSFFLTLPLFMLQESSARRGFMFAYYVYNLWQEVQFFFYPWLSILLENESVEKVNIVLLLPTCLET